MRAALFVDFDNIYLSFAELDERAAQRFATQPARWLAWFESGAHAFDGMESAAAPRRILVRRCYLNPVTFGRFRSDYTRAAFTAVDCPPLTQRGKTSADVYMVMDVLDALEHATRFDEFIILSSDADFTPVLLRLRAHDRRTTIIATNVAAAAYRAACDNIVPYERFFEEALAIEAEPSLQPEPEPTSDFEVLLPRVAHMLRVQVSTAGPLAARDVPIAFSAIPEFRNSSWFGCFSLRALMSRLLALEPALKLEGDPNAAWTVVLRDGAEGTQLPTADLARRAVQEVKGLVARAAHPVPMATAAQQVAQLLGPGLRESHWAGYGTFKALLTAHPQPDLMLVESRGGFLLDPARHDRGAADELPEELAAFARRVSTITGTPPLSPAEYAGLFAALAALSTCEPAEPNELSRAVRDRLHAEGLPVSRAQINFVLNGFRYTGFEIPGRSACDLARAWRENMLSLLDSAQVELSGVEYQLLARWLLGMPAGTLEPVPEDCPSDTGEVVAG